MVSGSDVFVLGLFSAIASLLDSFLSFLSIALIVHHQRVWWSEIYQVYRVL